MNISFNAVQFLFENYPEAFDFDKPFVLEHFSLVSKRCHCIALEFIHRQGRKWVKSYHSLYCLNNTPLPLSSFQTQITQAEGEYETLSKSNNTTIDQKIAKLIDIKHAYIETISKIIRTRPNLLLAHETESFCGTGGLPPLSFLVTVYKNHLESNQSIIKRAYDERTSMVCIAALRARQFLTNLSRIIFEPHSILHPLVQKELSLLLTNEKVQRIVLRSIIWEESSFQCLLESLQKRQAGEILLVAGICTANNDYCLNKEQIQRLKTIKQLLPSTVSFTYRELESPTLYKWDQQGHTMVKLSLEDFNLV